MPIANGLRRAGALAGGALLFAVLGSPAAWLASEPFSFFQALVAGIAAAVTTLALLAIVLLPTAPHRESERRIAFGRPGEPAIPR
jgi:hypothetical protein